MSLKKKMQDLKREAILEEAARLFNNDGYEHMKIADLAKNVGVSVGSIYTMFGSKENLFNNYILHQIDHFSEIIRQEIETVDDPLERMRILLRIKFTAMTQNRKALEISFLHDPTFFYNHLGADESGDPMCVLYDLITTEIMAPLLGDSTRMTPLEMVLLLDGLTIGVIKYWMLTDGDLVAKVDETIARFMRLIEG